jgi:hypothetical protein
MRMACLPDTSRQRRDQRHESQDYGSLELDPVTREGLGMPASTAETQDVAFAEVGHKINSTNVDARQEDRTPSVSPHFESIARSTRRSWPAKRTNDSRPRSALGGLRRHPRH